MNSAICAWLLVREKPFSGYIRPFLIYNNVCFFCCLFFIQAVIQEIIKLTIMGMMKKKAMNVNDIVLKSRDGGILSKDELSFALSLKPHSPEVMILEAAPTYKPCC